MHLSQEYDADNIFAKIIKGQIPCNKIYEDDYFLAFHDIMPRAPIHGLLIPKGPYSNASHFFQNASPEEFLGLPKAARHTIETLGLGENGFRMITNQGLHGAQEVPHFHIHILGGRSLGPILFDDL